MGEVNSNNCSCKNYEIRCDLINKMRGQKYLSRFTVNIPEQCTELEAYWFIKRIYGEIGKLGRSVGLTSIMEITEKVEQIDLKFVMEKVEDAALIVFFNKLRKDIPETKDWILSNRNFSLSVDEKKKLDDLISNTSVYSLALGMADSLLSKGKVSQDNYDIFNAKITKTCQDVNNFDYNNYLFKILEQKFNSEENCSEKAEDIRIWMKDNTDKLMNIKKFQLYSLVPSEIGQLTNLTSLDISGCKIMELPNEIINLVNLEELFLLGNRLISLPSELTMLTNLKDLRLGENNLKLLPSGFGKLTHLNHLSLYANELMTFPESFTQLDSLEHLSIYGNKFEAIPQELGKLKSLNSFYIDSSLVKDKPKIGLLEFERHMTSKVSVYRILEKKVSGSSYVLSCAYSNAFLD